MNTRSLFAIGFVAIATHVSSCAVVPKWAASHVREIHFRDAVPGELVFTVRSQNEIEELLGCFRRAVRVGETSGRAVAWPMCFDLVGERPERGRYLYDPGTGDFARLDPFSKPIYQLAASDRARMNAYF